VDLHTSNLFRLVKTAAQRHQRLDGKNLPKPYKEADPKLPTERLTYIGGGVDVAEFDDDSPVRPKPVKLFLRFNNTWMPFRDKPTFWNNPVEGRAGIEAVFGKFLPKPAVVWKDSGVELTELWARQGLGAQHLHRIREGGQVGEAFVSSFEQMARYEVRDGLLPYGGAAYLTEEGKITRIRLGGKDVRPGDAGWDHAAFVYRSSSIVWTTLSDHVFRCHYVFLNPILLATKRYLSLAHPLRHFIAPFHYRTAAINNGGALTLAPPGGMFHRTTGFGWDTLRHVYDDCVGAFHFETFEAGLRRRGMHPEQLGPDAVRLFPYSTDGLEYWKRTHAFVDEAFTQSPGLSSMLSDANRAATVRWWDSIHAAFPGGLPPLSEASLRDFLAQIIVTVTAFHEHVGNVSQYLVNPALGAGKLWPNQTIADQQASLQLCVVACITGLPMPKLMEDFSHMMPDPQAAAAFKHFQESLTGWQKDVDARNAARPQPFISFSPRELSCSISI
jgi:hypothetical protein